MTWDGWNWKCPQITGNWANAVWFKLPDHPPPQYPYVLNRWYWMFELQHPASPSVYHQKPVRVDGILCGRVSCWVIFPADVTWLTADVTWLTADVTWLTADVTWLTAVYSHDIPVVLALLLVPQSMLLEVHLEKKGYYVNMLQAISQSDALFSSSLNCSQAPPCIHTAVYTKRRRLFSCIMWQEKLGDS